MVELRSDHVDGIGEIDHLGMTLKVAFTEDGLLLVQLGQLGLETGDGAVAGDVADFEEAAAGLLHAFNLTEQGLGIEAAEPGGGEGGVDGAEPLAHDVHAVVERDEVVLAAVFLQLALGGFGLLAQFLSPVPEVVHGELVLAAGFLHEVAHELVDKTIGKKGRALGIAVGDRDCDQKAVADGQRLHGAQQAADGRGIHARGQILEVRALQELDFVGGERLGHHGAQPATSENLEIST